MEGLRSRLLWKKTDQVDKSENLFDEKPLENDEFLWAYEIMNFFSIPSIYQQEKESAIKIEEFLVKCK